MVQSFSPTYPDSDNIVVPDGLIARASAFASRLKVTDLAGLAPATEKTQFVGTTKGIKKKGGNPPRDYSAVETLLDLKLHLSRGEFPEALSAYFYLRRLVEGS